MLSDSSLADRKYSVGDLLCVCAVNGVSRNPCSDTYSGDVGGSELETQAVQAYLNNIGSNTWAVVTLHAYGFDWMHPWGTTTEPYNDFAPCDLADDHQDMVGTQKVDCNLHIICTSKNVLGQTQLSWIQWCMYMFM